MDYIHNATDAIDRTCIGYIESKMKVTMGMGIVVLISPIFSCRVT